jgi:hypothetical protein
MSRCDGAEVTAALSKEGDAMYPRPCYNPYTYYREVIGLIARFTALRFTETGAPPAARRIQILSMNQYACWLITFGMK